MRCQQQSAYKHGLERAHRHTFYMNVMPAARRIQARLAHKYTHILDVMPAVRRIQAWADLQTH
eukprot:1162018-Pelagomonas_calceolata.AAC.14